MKRILLLFACLSLLFSCQQENDIYTTVNREITSGYLLSGDLDIYLQNNQIFRYKGKPGIEVIPIGKGNLSMFEDCFVLYVSSGLDIETVVSSAIIKLDGIEVLTTSDFPIGDVPYKFEICKLSEQSVLEVEVRGKPGSYIDLWIEGKIDPEVNEFYDLNDNQVPMGWELVVLNPDVVLESGKFIAKTVDAQGSLRRYLNIPTSITRLECEWDGNLAPTYWGMTNHLQLILDDNSTLEIYLQTAQAWGIDNNKLRFIYYREPYGDVNTFQDLGTWLVPLKYGDFHYKVIVNDNQVQFTCNDPSNNTTYVDQSINIPTNISFNLQRIKSVNYTPNATTENDNWMDNLAFRLVK